MLEHYSYAPNQTYRPTYYDRFLDFKQWKSCKRGEKKRWDLVVTGVVKWGMNRKDYQLFWMPVLGSLWLRDYLRSPHRTDFDYSLKKPSLCHFVEYRTKNHMVNIQSEFGMSEYEVLYWYKTLYFISFQ